MNAALAWLYSLQRFGIKPGLETMRRLLRELQLPGPRMRFLHVAGTNGKGSVCAFMERVLRCAGERTGLFTSPHLVCYAERMRCGGESPAEQELAAGIEALRAMVHGWVPHPTFFELTLALALDWMERRGAHWVVLEAGMGGRLDATNVVTPAVSVITPVAMDHEQWLGNSLAEIAAEKAGIIKPGVPAVSARQHPDAERVLRDAARAAGTEIRFVTEPWPGRLPLPGTHQQWNAALALAALEAAGLRPPPEVVQQGLADTIWPGRFQIMEGGRLVVDGAHNPHGTAATAQTWREVFPGQKATLIYGAVAAKDYQASLQCLAGVAARCFTVTLQSPRALPAAQLAAAVPPGTMQTKAWDSLETALAAARTLPERILICGSLYLCGETLALLTGKTHELSAQ